MALNNLTFKLTLIICLAVAFWPNSVWAEKLWKVMIVANSQDQPYLLAIQGFREELSAKRNVTFKEFFLGLSQNIQNSLSAQIAEQKPDLIYTLGSESTEVVRRIDQKTPIVSTMIFKRASDKLMDKITGVYLNYPFSIQFQWLKKFFPEQRKIAIFYNPKENKETIHEARKIAEQEALEIVAISVESPKELPYALERLQNNIEVLLAIPDEIAMSPKTAKEVLLASFRNRVPLIGLSDNWVKSGALYALSWDYADLGRQCALQSDKLLRGASLQDVPLEYPRKTTYSINAKIAEHMNMEIPQTLLIHAKHVFNDDRGGAE